MKYSELTQRVRGEGADVWDSHYAAAADKAAGEDVIILSVGDPDLATPDSVIDAATTAMKNGDTHYTSIAGSKELRSTIAERHQNKSGQQVSLDNVIITSGAQNALFNVTMCLVEKGDEVIVLQPMYVTYEASIAAPDATLVPVVLQEADGFRLDRRTLEEAITDKTRAIYFATPSNPTGVMLKQDELEIIAELAIKHDLWVVSDEVYSDLVFNGEFHHICSLPGMSERTVTLGSMSKTFAMTGWRLGWAIGPTELVGHIEMLALCMLYGLPGFVQQASLHALENCENEADEMRDIYLRRRDYMYREIQAIEGLKPLLPDAGMFLMIDVRGTGLSTREFVDQLYQQQKVSVLDATAFGASAAGYVRVSYGIADEDITNACQRIKTFVESLSV